MKILKIRFIDGSEREIRTTQESENSMSIITTAIPKHGVVKIDGGKDGQLAIASNHVIWVEEYEDE